MNSLQGIQNLDLPRLAYFLRYVFIFFSALGAGILFRYSWVQLNARLQLKAKALPGYYLLIEEGSSFLGKNIPAQARIRILRGVQKICLPLYPITVIGRSRSCDHRFSLPHWERRALVLFREQGCWKIQAPRSRTLVLNGVPLMTHAILQSRDELVYKNLHFRFIDERMETELAGNVYNELQADYESGHYDALKHAKKDERQRLELAEKLTRKEPILPWLFWNFFALCCMGLEYLLLPHPFGEHEPILMGMQLSIWGLLNLYFFLLPLGKQIFHRTVYLAFSYLIILGNTVQFRLNLIHRGQIDEAFHRGDWTRYYDLLDYVYKQFRTQNGALLLGLVIFPILFWSVSRSTILEKCVKIAWVGTPLLYLLSLLFARDPGGHGARLWISFGGFSIQLSEFAKIGYLLVLADVFSLRPPIRKQILFALWAIFNSFLVMLLPDLGSLMILLPTTLLVFVMMTSEYGVAAAVVLGGIGSAFFAYELFPHVQRRLQGWLDLGKLSTSGNEQILLGLRAVARGGFWGRGLGNGSPAGIPEAGSDMVFSVLIEEWGIFMGLLVVVFFAIIWLRGLYASAESEEGFHSAWVLSVATLFLVEASVVIAGTTGLLPLTGATLPFLAKGGSSLLAKLVLFALFLGVLSRKKHRPKWGSKGSTFQ